MIGARYVVMQIVNTHLQNNPADSHTRNLTAGSLLQGLPKEFYYHGRLRRDMSSPYPNTNTSRIRDLPEIVFRTRRHYGQISSILQCESPLANFKLLYSLLIRVRYATIDIDNRCHTFFSFPMSFPQKSISTSPGYIHFIPSIFSLHS